MCIRDSAPFLFQSPPGSHVGVVVELGHNDLILGTELSAERARDVKC